MRQSYLGMVLDPFINAAYYEIYLLRLVIDGLFFYVSETEY